MDKPQRKWLVRHAGDHGIYDNADDELFDVVERGEGWLISIATKLDRDTARLIAAAPDLVEALQDILEYSGGAASALDDEYVMDRARAALSKALGRTVTK